MILLFRLVLIVQEVSNSDLISKYLTLVVHGAVGLIAEQIVHGVRFIWAYVKAIIGELILKFPVEQLVVGVVGD
jgi:hypothetical protein